MLKWRNMLPVLAAMLLVGCATRRSYEVTVTNRTEWPITVGLVKEGPPFEPHLASVGQLAVSTPVAALPPWGIVVPPGKTADAKTSGAFGRGSELLLRVYRGQQSNLDLMAMNTIGLLRVDILLLDGKNQLIILDRNSRLDYDRAGANPR